jgi:hypothetical protein
MAFVDQQQIVDQHPFVVDRLAVGRHRSGRDPADVGVVAAPRGTKADGFGPRRQ